MTAAWPGPDRLGAGEFDVRVTLEELRERNLSAVAMDVLYLLTTAFFAHIFTRGFWPAVIATIPLATLLYFGWRSSRAFFGTQIAVIVAAVIATYAGIVPL